MRLGGLTETEPTEKTEIRIRNKGKMYTLVGLTPFIGVGLGIAAAYGATHSQSLKKRIHFVRPGNLEEELDEFDIEIDAIETCNECGEDIQPDEIGAVVKDNDHYKAICDDPECLDTYDVV